MDTVFQLSNGDRVSYLHELMHSFTSSYICLWTHSPNLNFLYCEYGCFQEEGSSSSGVSIAQQLFNEYKQSPFAVVNEFVPGLAFRDKIPCLELQDLDLLRHASIETQRQFYLEAKIKTAIFLGCDKGEIELGMSKIPQNLETKMQSLFPLMELQGQTDHQQNKPSSASSSQSMGDSPEYPTSFFYNFPTSSTFNLEDQSIRDPPSNLLDPQATSNIQSIHVTMTSNAATNTTTLGVPHHLHHPLLQNIPFPTPESTDAALTKAYLAILSSPSSSSRGGEEHCFPYQMRQKGSAFSNYQYSGSLALSSSQLRSNLRRQTLLKRAIAYYKGINIRRIHELALQGSSSRPTSTQLHHMISERRRREKINESFHALRSLLPQGTKKDKASVLRTTKEYLSTLKEELLELKKKNQLLEAQLSTKKSSNEVTTTTNLDLKGDERLVINVKSVTESTSLGDRMVDLQVILRRNTLVSNLITRVLNFLNQVNEASMVSMEAQTHIELAGAQDQIPTNWVTFRLRIEASEWDESAFVEALQRLLADLAS